MIGNLQTYTLINLPTITYLIFTHTRRLSTTSRLTDVLVLSLGNNGSRNSFLSFFSLYQLQRSRLCSVSHTRGSDPRTIAGGPATPASV